MNRGPRKRSKHTFLGLILGVTVFLVIQYGISLVRLNSQSRGMMNKFSALAEEKYLSFLILQNVYVILGYLILGACFIALLYPLVSFILSRLQTKRKGIWIFCGFIGSYSLHAFFTLRLAHTRPYFLNEGKFGNWYYQVLELIPESMSGVSFYLLFTAIPLIWISLAAVFYVWKLFQRYRYAGLSTIAGLALVVALFSYKSGPQDDEVVSQKKRPNVLLIGSDSLRGDRLGFAGYWPRRSDGLAAGGVSPQIDKLAAKSTVLKNCYTPIASTLESGTSLMTSLHPRSHGLRHMYPDEETVRETKKLIEPLPELLKKGGYDTAAFGDWCAGYYEMMPLGMEHVSVSSFDNFKIYMSQAVIMAHFVIPLYFDNELGYTIFPQISSFAQFVTPEVVTKRVVERMGDVSEKDKPFFWHVFYSCNHLPYRSPEPYNSMFADPAYSGPNKNGVDFDIDGFIGSTDLEDKWSALPEAEVQQIRDLYDGCTRQFDDNVGELLRALEGYGLSNDTIVVITSDHGDNLYEEGVTLGHGLTFQGGLGGNHVPLVFFVPGEGAKEIEAITRTTDIIPTLADLLDFEKPEGWEGRSVAKWIDGTELPTSRAFYGETGFPFIQFRVDGVQRPALPAMDEMTFIDESFNYQFVLKEEYEERLLAAKQHCLVVDDWMLICTPTDTGGRHFGLFSRGEKQSSSDVAEEHPDIVDEMTRALEKWMDRGVETPASKIFPP